MGKFFFATFIIVICTGIVCGDSFGESWEDTLKSNFDFVDTFDNYSDWRPSGTNYSVQDRNINGSGFNGIKYSDGSDSRWDQYQYSGIHTPDSDRHWVVYDHGSQRRVTGKSLVNSIMNKHSDQIPYYTKHVGTSWNKLYFGDAKKNTNAQDGYDEVYVFFRLWMSKKFFPTYDENNLTYDIDDIDDGTGKPIRQHVAGHRYAPMSSVKWISINNGFLNCRDWYDENNNSIDSGWNAYGSPEFWVHLKPKEYGGQWIVPPKVESFHAVSGYHAIHSNINVDTYFDTDTMVGVEIHLKMESVAGPDVAGGNTSDGLVEIWFYDEKGKGTLVLSDNKMAYRRIGEKGSKFNRLFLLSNVRTADEPNKSAGYFRPGTGMEAGWWLDDLIIDGQRIGPQYYSLLGTQPMPEPSVPNKGEKPAVF